MHMGKAYNEITGGSLGFFQLAALTRATAASSTAIPDTPSIANIA
jgi:hypothetical protein